MRIWQHFSASGPFKTNPQLLLKKNKWHTVNKLICEGLKLNSRRRNGFKECICENTTHSVTNCREESFSDSNGIAGIYIHGIWCLRFEVLSTVLIQQSSGMWHHVVCYTGTNTLEKPTSFTFSAEDGESSFKMLLTFLQTTQCHNPQLNDDVWTGSDKATLCQLYYQTSRWNTLKEAKH